MGLTSLRLTDCGIHDEDAACALAAGLHFTAVESLDLENNPINDPGFRAFLNPKSWNSLRRLLPPRIGVSEWMRRELDKKFRPARRG